MKRILMLNYEFPPLGGGAANATYYLLKEFAKEPDIKIDLITSSTDKQKKEAFSDNINIYYLDIGKNGNLHYQSNMDLLRYSWKAYRLGKRLKKKRKYDLVHAFFGIPCGYIAMKLGLPYIVSLRGSDVPFYNKRFYWPDKLLFKRLSLKIWKRSKAVIANSQGLKELALKSSPDQKIGVIYNGIDIEEFYPDKQKQKNDKLVLVSTGRLIARKGFEYLIEAIGEMENVELWLIGDGNLREELEKQARTSKAQAKFLGKKDHADIPELLRKADVFVLPSLNEGMSNSILEAMACGLPIIATDTGGTKELVDEDNGIIVKKENANDIRQAVEKLLSDRGLLDKMSRESRRKAEGMGWGRSKEEYLCVYNEG